MCGWVVRGGEGRGRVRRGVGVVGRLEGPPVLVHDQLQEVEGCREPIVTCRRGGGGGGAVYLCISPQ